MPAIARPEDDAEIKRLWDLDVTAAEIGRRLGRTKNAIVGRAHRIGCAFRPPAKMGMGRQLPSEKVEQARTMILNGQSDSWIARHAKIDPKTARRLRTNMGVGRLRQTDMREIIPNFDQPPVEEVSRSTVLPMFWVAPVKKYVPPTIGQCLWLDGDRPNFLQCDGLAVPGRSYCDGHCRAAYTTYGRRVAA